MIHAERQAQTAGQGSVGSRAGSGATGGAGDAGMASAAGSMSAGSGGAGSGGSAGSAGSTAGAMGDVPTPVTCGDGEVDLSEKCDVAIPAGQPGACPSACPMLECQPRKLTGSMCSAACVEDVLTCVDGDGCCGADCDHANDSDCPVNCGDGTVQADQGETCEPGSETPCPSEASCKDELACTKDVLEGSAENCNAKCSNTEITTAINGDGCCLPGSNHNVDNDCVIKCGNKVREMGEECDGDEGCENCKLSSTLTADQERCMDLLGGKGDACDRCACLQCTKQALDCRGSGDARRDAQCTKVLDCANDKNCVRDICYCGATNPLCLNPFEIGPCRTEIDEAVASEPAGKGDVIRQRDDPSTAIGRAVITTDCNALNCADVCP